MALGQAVDLRRNSDAEAWSHSICECKEGLLQEAIYFALAKTNNTQIKLKEEQKEAVRQIVNEGMLNR